MKYGDVVVLVQKNGSDGSLRRLNAIVLASANHAPNVLGKPASDVKKLHADAVEHLDLAFAVPTLVPDGGVLKTRNLEEIFRPAFTVAPYVADAWIGWEPAVAEVVDERIEGSPREVVEAAQFREASEIVARLRKGLADSEELVVAQEIKITSLEAQIAGMTKAPEPAPGQPSAADLDAVAAEQAAKDATSGEAPQG